ncbi:MAG: Lrp/AsnC family transcriptional regulator [Mycobacteriaceae bacterium]
MNDDYSYLGVRNSVRSNNIQQGARTEAGLPIRPADLDEIDHRIIEYLQGDARISNSALAEVVGIAPSTCHGRVRRLLDSGVIRGFFADIDPVALGRPLRAMIAVSLQSHARGSIRSFVKQISTLPEVIDVYFLAGADDYLLHVAASDTEDLRRFVVENLNARPEVAGTQTSLVFEHLRGSAPLR